MKIDYVHHFVKLNNYLKSLWMREMFEVPQIYSYRRKKQLVSRVYTNTGAC